MASLDVTVVERRSSSKLLPDMSRLIPAQSPYQTVLVNVQSAYMNASIAYARKLVQGWDVSRIKKVTDEDIFDIWGIQVGGK